MVDNLPSNPANGLGMEYTPQTDQTPAGANVFLRFRRHKVFPANTAAYTRHGGPQPQLGTMLEITKAAD